MKRERCKDCDARLTDANSKPYGDGSVRPQCRSCFNASRNPLGRAPGRPKDVDPVAPLEAHRLRERVKSMEAEKRSLLADLDRKDVMRETLAEARSLSAKVRPIVPREKQGGGVREATALVLASDWHIEERVLPEQVAGRNRFNLEIARKRMTRFFEATRWGLDFSRNAFTIRDTMLWLGGDLLTNYLHPDNVESNELSPPQALAELQVDISAGIETLLKDPRLERLVIPCNGGNHGRLSEKTRSATRSEMCLETLLYTSLAREFKHEKRVQFVIAEGEHLYQEVYGRTIRFTHGDTVRYAGGVGGVTIPLYKALARWDTVRRADLTCVGHFHQLTQLRDLIINGSLIGYSPYALTVGARFEPPAQSFTVLDPLRFNSVSMPLWVGERGDDAASR